MEKKSSSKQANDLFTTIPGNRLNACIEYYGRDWSLYSAGYKEAGEIIANEMIQSCGPVDILVYPMIFLYRQAIELKLKDILIDANQLTSVPYKVSISHNIINLWADCKKIFKKIKISQGLRKEIIEIEKLIIDFDKIDSKSFAFRYPEDTKGSHSLPGITHINVGIFYNIVEEIYSSLEAISTYISESLTFKWEMESEYYTEYE